MNQKINIAITAVFLALLFGFGIAFWAVPDTDFSAEENRALQTLPAFSVSSWMDGTTSGQLTDYYADQFPLRTSWVSLHALCDLAAGRGESSGVLLGRDGQLAVRRFDAYLSRTERAEDTDFYSTAHIEAGLRAIADLDSALSEAGIPLCVLAAPRTLDVTISDYNYPAALSDELTSAVENGLDAAQVNSVNLTDTFRTMYEAGEYVYYRTDHHWTTYGAYTAYTAVMEAWGMGEAVIPADRFEVRRVENFYGTTYSRSGMFFVPADTLEIWEIRDGSDADSTYTVKDGDGNTVIEQGFISEAYLSEKDKYGAFLDGTHSLLTITQASAADGDRPRLLLARDSFASCMVPFLARHFDIVAVNLSGGMTNLSELAEAYDCDRVLIICNLENFVTSDCVVRIQ